jgi:hypothetical protein
MFLKLLAVSALSIGLAAGGVMAQQSNNNSNGNGSGNGSTSDNGNSSNSAGKSGSNNSDTGASTGTKDGGKASDCNALATDKNTTAPKQDQTNNSAATQSCP